MSTPCDVRTGCDTTRRQKSAGAKVDFVTWLREAAAAGGCYMYVCHKMGKLADV
jgi:hypothetical protein